MIEGRWESCFPVSPPPPPNIYLEMDKKNAATIAHISYPFGWLQKKVTAGKNIM